MANISNMSRLIIFGIKRFLCPPSTFKYPETIPLKLFLDWLIPEDGNYQETTKINLRRRRYYAGKLVRQMIKEKLIVADDKAGLVLTKRGEALQTKYEFEDYKILKTAKWDGNYRVIIFDIAEQKRRLRGELRRRLVAMGFVRLQNSVWVFPYECQEFVSLLKTYLGVVSDVIYMEVHWIENDKWLRKEFGLS